eukprot:462942_1
MSVERLNINDVILFQTNYKEYIGIIKYIGLIYGLQSMSEYIGIELIESIGNDGHSGTINNYSYFMTKKGFGTHCKLTDVIKKLKPFEIFKLYQNSLSQKQTHIQNLEKQIQQILNNNKCKKSQPCTPITPIKLSNAINNRLRISRLSRLTDIPLIYDPITPTTPLSNISLSPKQSISNKTMLSKTDNSIQSITRKSIASLFSDTSDDELPSFPDTKPIVPTFQKENIIMKQKKPKIPVDEFRRKKHKKRRNKKKKRRSFISQSDDNRYQINDIPVFRHHSHSAPNRPNQNNGTRIKHVQPQMDKWIDKNNSKTKMKSYEEFMNEAITPIQDIDLSMYQENKFLFVAYQ